MSWPQNIVHLVMFVNTCCFTSFQLCIPSHIHLFTNQFDRCSAQCQSNPLDAWSWEGSFISVLPIYWGYSSLEGGCSFRILTQMQFRFSLISQDKAKPWKLRFKFRWFGKCCPSKSFFTYIWPDNFLLFWQIFEVFRKIYFCYIYFV